jgi:hypothetical protein
MRWNLSIVVSLVLEFSDLHCRASGASIVVHWPPPLSCFSHLHCPASVVSIVVLWSSPLSCFSYLHCPASAISIVRFCLSLYWDIGRWHCMIVEWFITVHCNCLYWESVRVHYQYLVVFVSGVALMALTGYGLVACGGLKRAIMGHCSWTIMENVWLRFGLWNVMISRYVFMCFRKYDGVWIRIMDEGICGFSKKSKTQIGHDSNTR